MADDLTRTMQETGGKNRSRRRKIYYTAILHIRELSANCRVRDLSEGGLLIETNLPLWDGAPCELELPKVGRVAGVIVWANWPRAGLAFNHPLDPATLATIMGQPPASRPVPVASDASWRRGNASDTTIKAAQERARDAVSWLRQKPKGR